jgi:hypothetical protein
MDTGLDVATISVDSVEKAVTVGSGQGQRTVGQHTIGCRTIIHVTTSLHDDTR